MNLDRLFRLKNETPLENTADNGENYVVNAFRKLARKPHLIIAVLLIAVSEVISLFLQEDETFGISLEMSMVTEIIGYISLAAAVCTWLGLLEFVFSAFSKKRSGVQSKGLSFALLGVTIEHIMSLLLYVIMAVMIFTGRSNSAPEQAKYEPFIAVLLLIFMGLFMYASSHALRHVRNSLLYGKSTVRIPNLLVCLLLIMAVAMLLDAYTVVSEDVALGNVDVRTVLTAVKSLLNGTAYVMFVICIKKYNRMEEAIEYTERITK